MKHLLLCCLFAGFVSGLMGQQTGTIDYKHLGIRFTIPDGWVGQETEAGFVMGHNSIPGLMLIAPHQSQSISHLKQEMAEGLQEEGGTSLAPIAPAQHLDAQSLGVEFGGLLEWQPSKAYGIGMINPNGSGVYILAITTAGQYNETYAEYAKSLWRSVSFYKPDNRGIVNQWKKALSHGRLTYVDSYNSPSYTDGGIGGGYSQRRVIELCRQGHFFYSNQSEIIVSGYNASGYDQSSDQGHGK
ncbi:MAG: hypothetical protein AAFV07_15200, partial [Bacteroidota bacterium]